MKKTIFACMMFALPLMAADRSVCDAAHEALLKFVSPSGMLWDYLGPIPTQQEMAECRPNAKGWWTPIENGPMFTGPWLAACAERARRSGSEADRALCRRLSKGLLLSASVSDVPGFIARGVGEDGESHYPVGSMDQTLPWYYGLWSYLKSGVPARDEAAAIKAKMLEVARALERNDWKCPCEGVFAKEDCGDFVNDGLPFRNAAHGLFLFRILAELEPSRKAFYDKMAKECPKGSVKTRLAICATGYEADIPKLPHLEPHLLWIYVVAQGCLRELAELEPDEPAFRKGLAANADRAAKFMKLGEKYDNSTEAPFRYANWRTGYKWWRQRTLKESDAVSRTGDKAVLGTRKNFERDTMTNPLAAAAICAFAGKNGGEIDTLLARYDWRTLNISEFFLAEVVAFAEPPGVQFPARAR